ncbi:hypothetical protein ARMGADRAFT_1070663 [Armillaria gallica]|uniref:Uncharacterized protein n=1 Tax=Armillaria gallica TaxID=47427 RepID=A0A2H3ED69_ARMGA|nr:hypothetical protein ARMGADRAFT_1070663 [Armillaria gallica]
MALNRSEGTEVSVVFIGSDRQCVWPRLVEVLCQVMARSQLLWNLELHLSSSLIPILSALAGRIPNLHRCMVHFMGDIIFADCQTDAFAIAPRLKQLTLTGFGPGSMFSIPCSSIISYEDVRDCRVGEGVHDSILSISDTHITYYAIFDILTKLHYLTTLALGFTQWYEACEAVVHDIIVALSAIVGEDVIGPYRVAPVLLRLVVTASEPLDDGQGSIGFVWVHFADMVEGQCSHLTGHVGKVSVMVKVGSPFLDFPRMYNEVIMCLVECRQMGHDICVAGYIDGDYMNNIVTDDSFSVDLDN